ncbi:MAG TPA: MFS transporter [Ktedonobacterales bacterium]|nr:MFS transporter [Ktedonobacterales bacterium]
MARLAKPRKTRGKAEPGGRIPAQLPPVGGQPAVAATTGAAQGAAQHDQFGGEALHLTAAVPAATTRPAAVPSRARLGFRTVMRNPLFLRLWVAQLISQTIGNAANYGMIILIATQSKSVTATGGAIAAFSLPAALFGAPAGVIVDRFDKRFVLWMSNALRALAAVGFVVTLLIDPHALWPVYFLILFIAVIGQFFAPAEGAAIPMLVHRDELVNALALFNITFTLSQAAGLIVLGPLIIATLPSYNLGAGVVISPVMSLFLLVGALFAVCALLVGTIPHQKLVNRDRPAGAPGDSGVRSIRIWGDIREAWRFVRGDHTLLAAVLQLSISGMVISILAEIAPRFVKVFFNLPEVYAALVFVPAGAGLVLGSVALPHLVKRVRRQQRIIGGGLLTLAASAMLITLIHTVVMHLPNSRGASSRSYIIVVLALTFVMGFALDLINIPAQTTMQGRSPDSLRGRVLALQGMLFNAATVPLVFLIGLLADAYSLPPAILALAGFVLLAGFATLVYGHQARQANPSLPLVPGVSRSGPLAEPAPAPLDQHMDQPVDQHEGARRRTPSGAPLEPRQRPRGSLRPPPRQPMERTSKR